MKHKERLPKGQLRFHPAECKVEHNGETIQCLPKEYALLEFLYEHANHAFSRTQLLDRVWGLEEPTDRTVDDHIYRLRKKLQPWKSWLCIDTVRGYGYKLSVAEPPLLPAPLLHDQEVKEHFAVLINKYHGFGMGGALQALADNQEILGLQLPPFYAIFTRFVSGDFHWIVETDSLAFWEKAFYLLHLHALIQFDPEQTQHFFQRAVRSKHLLREEWQKEIEFNMISIYLETERIAESRALLETAREFVFGMNSPSFQLIWYVDCLYLAILTQDKENAQITIEAAESLLKKFPIQRELGLFTVAKGIWMYQIKDRKEARRLLDEGIEILQQTQFIPHLLSGVHHILRYLRKHACDEECLRAYEKLWRGLSQRHRLQELEQKITSLLYAHL